MFTSLYILFSDSPVQHSILSLAFQVFLISLQLSSGSFAGGETNREEMSLVFGGNLDIVVLSADLSQFVLGNDTEFSKEDLNTSLWRSSTNCSYSTRSGSRPSQNDGAQSLNVLKAGVADCLLGQGERGQQVQPGDEVQGERFNLINQNSRRGYRYFLSTFSVIVLSLFI